MVVEIVLFVGTGDGNVMLMLVMVLVMGLVVCCGADGVTESTVGEVVVIIILVMALAV